MKNKIFFLLLLSIVVISCSKSIMKTNINSLPFSSDSLKKFYYYDNETSSYKIKTQLLQKNEFTNIDKSIIPKNFENYFTNNKFYYPVLKFSKNSYQYIGILYEGYVDSEYNCLFFQLNSYDGKGKFIDALLLDNKFTFEVTYWNDFKIQKDGNIAITEYSENNLLIDDSGNIIDIIEQPKIDSTILKYKINSQTGKFELIETIGN